QSVPAPVTGLVLAGLLVSLIVFHGRRAIVWSPAHLALGALLTAYAAATLLALDQETALFGAWRRYLGLDQMVDNVVLYSAAVLLLPATRDLGRLAVVALSTAAVVVLYMFVQALGLDPVKYTAGRPPVIGTFGQPDV